MTTSKDKTDKTAGVFDDYIIDFDQAAADSMMQFKGRDYMTVQKRLLWFIRDQRNFIAAGIAKVGYMVHTEAVEVDLERGYAQFKTFVRDVLGNEATMYGSETKADFAEYAEKASTKSLGRALLALGYGTAFAQEMDEGERVVDSPQPPRRPTPTRPIASPINIANQANDGGGVSPLSLTMEHLPLGTTRETVAAFAKEKGLDRAAWEAIWTKHNGALPAMWIEIRAALRAPAHPQP